MGRPHDSALRIELRGFLIPVQDAYFDAPTNTLIIEPDYASEDFKIASATWHSTRGVR